MKIAILGGGFTGLTAAYYLQKKGHQVTVFEKEKTLGGMAAGFKTNNWDWYLEKTVHHLFANDDDILNFAKEIKFDEIFFREPETASLYSISDSVKKFLSRDQLASPDSIGEPLAPRSSSESEVSLRRSLAQTTDSRKNFLDSSTSINNWQLAMSNFGEQWLPVDWYLGGAEHAVLHLLYARFWIKALYDLKLINFDEPFLKLRNVGMILAEDHRKMSKSLGNVINPDRVVAEYGADTLRVYEMFMAPFSQEIAWSTRALQGAYRFVKRVWDLYRRNYTYWRRPSPIGKIINEDKQLVVKLQKTIAKVTKDITDVKFNTAIAAMMEFLNEWEEIDVEARYHVSRFNRNTPPQINGSLKSAKQVSSPLNIENAKRFLQILAPFAPFITEEIWHEVFGEKQSIHLSTWPKVEGKIVEEEIVIPVQVNGKLRATVTVPAANLSETAVVDRSLEEERVKKYLQGKKYKVIYVEGKILNFVTK